MASNNISKYYKVDNGLDLTSDSQFATLSANEKIVYKPSGEKYIKNSNYSNVFDKTDTFGELETEIKANAVRRIENTNNQDGTTNYYSIDGTKLGSFISGVSPKDLSEGLGNVRSTSISSIDDANGNGVCSCKNTSGSQVDTFTCHVSKSASNPTLMWGSTSTIGTVDGTPLTVTMPSNPDTKYSAGTGLTLNGTTFSISQEILDKINNSGSTTGWTTFYFKSDEDFTVGDIISGSRLYTGIDLSKTVGSGSWRLVWVDDDIEKWTSGKGWSSYYGRFQKVG